MHADEVSTRRLLGRRPNPLLDVGPDAHALTTSCSTSPSSPPGMCAQSRTIGQSLVALLSASDGSCVSRSPFDAQCRPDSMPLSMSASDGFLGGTRSPMNTMVAKMPSGSVWRSSAMEVAGSSLKIRRNLMP